MGDDGHIIVSDINAYQEKTIESSIAFRDEILVQDNLLKQQVRCS